MSMSNAQSVRHTHTEAWSFEVIEGKRAAEVFNSYSCEGNDDSSRVIEGGVLAETWLQHLHSDAKQEKYLE